MATQAIRDQNFDVAPSGLKTNKAAKNGGLGGRKALGDISNSARPSLFQTLKKLDSKNVISVAEDFGGLSKSKSSLEGKTKASKAAGKQAGARKALGDLTNSIKPRVVEESKKTNQIKKLSAVVEEPYPLECEGIGEGFLHDHQKCIKAQEKARALDLDYFLKEIGLGNSMQSSPPCVSPLSTKMKPESPISFTELDEMFEPRYDDLARMFNEEALCASPKSPTPSFLWEHDDLLNFKLMESP